MFTSFKYLQISSESLRFWGLSLDSSKETRLRGHYWRLQNSSNSFSILASPWSFSDLFKYHQISSAFLRRVFFFFSNIFRFLRHFDVSVIYIPFFKMSLNFFALPWFFCTFFKYLQISSEFLLFVDNLPFLQLHPSDLLCRFLLRQFLLYRTPNFISTISFAMYC